MKKIEGRIEVGQPLFLCQNLPYQAFARTNLPTQHQPTGSSGPMYNKSMMKKDLKSAFVIKFSL